MTRIEDMGGPFGEVDGVLDRTAEGVVHAPRPLVAQKRVAHRLEELGLAGRVHRVGHAQSRPLQLQHAREFLGIGQPMVQRHQGEPPVGRRQGKEHVHGAVGQIHRHHIAWEDALIPQPSRKLRGDKPRLAIGVGRLVTAPIDRREEHGFRTQLRCAFENIDHERLVELLGRDKLNRTQEAPAGCGRGRSILRKFRELGEVGSALLLEGVAALLGLVGGVVQKRGVAGQLL